MLERLRGLMERLLTPTAKLLLQRGVSPDLITWLGTGFIVLVALFMVPQGWLWQAALIMGVVSLTDMVDGQMARLSGKSSAWGAFLDSTLDRIADGAVFGGVAIWFAVEGHPIGVTLTLVALVMGQVTSYVKARAESQGWQILGGLAARADRIFVLLLGMLLQGFGLPHALLVAVAALALASAITVAQRMRQAYRQAQVDHG